MNSDTDFRPSRELAARRIDEWSKQLSNSFWVDPSAHGRMLDAYIAAFDEKSHVPSLDSADSAMVCFGYAIGLMDCKSGSLLDEINQNRSRNN